MSLGKVFGIAGSAVSAQSMRLSTTASNLANAETVAGPDGSGFKARQVIFRSEAGAEPGSLGGVSVAQIREDERPGRRVHDPSHPFADEQGYITRSNVEVVDQMVDMISASRAYQNNLEVMNTAKQLLLKTLQMGQ